MVSFRKCDICGKPLEGPAAEQHVVENRPIDAAEGAVLQRELPRGIEAEEICADCLRAYREGIGRWPPSEDPPV